MIQREYSQLMNRTVDVKDMRIGQISIDKKWTWISMVDRLANGDPTKYKDIYKMKYIECLNILAWWHVKDKYHEQMKK